MPLKAVHLLFISLSILLAWGFGGWCVHQGRFALGILSMVVGAVLVCYGVWFIKKLKKIKLT